MTTETLVKNLVNEVGKLRAEVAEVKRVFFAVPEDSEGEYQEGYVKKIFARSRSQKPVFLFTSKEEFLKYVRKAS